MKIGLVLDDGLDTPDGVQQYVTHVGAWLSSQGHEVHYLVGETTRRDIENIHVMSRNVHVRFNGNRMSVPLPTSRKRLKIFLKEHDFDILHVQAIYSPFMAGRLILSASATTAVIGTFHNLPYSKLVAWSNWILARLNYRSGKRFDRMLAVSSPARTFSKKWYGYDSEVLPNPVDVQRFSAGVSTSDELTVVFLGRLVERKGAQYLLQAIDLILKDRLFTEKFRVLIGGKGELIGEMQDFIEQKGLQEVVSLKGFIEETDKPDFLAQADIAVYPSTAGESFGIVLLEAMAASRGVVLGGNNPGYSSVLSPYPDQLFDPTDVRAFAEKLAWYLDHQAARERATELQHQYVQHFDTSVVGTKLLEIYNEALQSRRSS